MKIQVMKRGLTDRLPFASLWLTLGIFALVLLGSVFLLEEELSLRRIVGVLAIFGGILLAAP